MWLLSTCRHRRASAVLPLPPAVIGGGELMAMTQAHFGDTDCVAITLVHLTSDVVIATGLGQERLQLFHRHGLNLQKGFFISRSTSPVSGDTLEFLPVLKVPPLKGANRAWTMDDAPEPEEACLDPAEASRDSARVSAPWMHSG